MLRTFWMALLMPLVSASAALAQENAVERNAQTDNGMGIIPWIIIAIVIAAAVFWAMRRRGRGL
jgi:hypothetical protein